MGRWLKQSGGAPNSRLGGGMTEASTEVVAARQERILVVLGAPPDRTLLRAMADAGVERSATSVYGVSEALERLAAAEYDLVLLDLPSTGAEGFESVAAISRAAPDAAILVLSESRDREEAVRALDLGAQELLQRQKLAAPTLARAMAYAQSRKRKERQLSALVMADPMTGLPNRRAFELRLDELVDQVAAPDGQPFALLFIDLDRFKPINDQLGHAAGDEVLRVVASRLAAGIRGGDMVARLGGDEFAVLAHGPIDEESSLRLARRLGDAVGQPITLVGHGVRRVSAAVGLVLCPQAAQEPAALCALADSAMYEAKRGGRGGVVLHPRADVEASVDGVEDMLRRALTAGPLAVWWRPRLDLVERGVPTLVATPQWEGVPPGDTTDLERLTFSAADLEVAEVLVRRALEQVDSDELESAARMGPTVYSLGVTAPLLLRDDLVVDIIRAHEGLAERRVSMELCLPELTRGAERRRLRAVLAYLGRFGLRVALSDFGKCSCPLEELADLHIHGLRLPAPWGRDPAMWPVVRGVNALGAALELQVVATGACTSAEVEALGQAGLRFVEGAPAASLDGAARVFRGLAPWSSGR
ncbi:MAG: diguanylate cyclase [Alphaproteobacteria bacterium]|nr:diguanylate cyclase [Alphaproteobacteria bacterium]